MATVGKFAVGRFEILQVDLVAFPAGCTLQRDKVGKGADRRFDTVYATDIRTSQEIRKPNRRRLLREQIEIAMRRRKVDRPISGNAALRDRRAVGTSRAPAIDQSADALDVAGIGIEDGIDIACGPYDPMANQCDPANQHIADAGAIEVVQNSAEARHRTAAASSAAWTLRATPSASNSSGSRSASRISR